MHNIYPQKCAPDILISTNFRKIILSKHRIHEEIDIHVLGLIYKIYHGIINSITLSTKRFGERIVEKIEKPNDVP